MNKITEKGHMRNGNMDQQQKRSLKALIRYLRMKTWKAKAQPELGLIKINRKGFYSYASRKRKLKESADPLMRWGRQPSDSVGKIGEFNAFLAFIFAGESRFSYICVFSYRLGRRWADHIREQQVKDYLKQLDIPRSMVLDRIHLRKLKGLAM